jgi:TBC1 domain family member 10
LSSAQHGGLPSTRRESTNSHASSVTVSAPISPAAPSSPPPGPIAYRAQDAAAFLSAFHIGDYDESRRTLAALNPGAKFLRNDDAQYKGMKARARKGVPEDIRGLAWRFMANSLHDTAANPSVYAALLSKKLPQDTHDYIANDTGRTLPSHPLFNTKEAGGQQALHNVLHAYATIDPEVGYCQGMGYVAGTLLTLMPEEEAFWTFHAMMHNAVYRMREMYLPGLPGTHLFFFQLNALLMDYCPSLHRHLEAQKCEMSFFAKSWFMTLFVYEFEFDALMRVWDIFFCEGWTIVFRVGLALLQWEEPRLLGLPLDEMLPRLKSLHEGKDPDQVLARAFRFHIKHEHLHSLKAKFESLRSPTRAALRH